MRHVHTMYKLRKLYDIRKVTLRYRLHLLPPLFRYFKTNYYLVIQVIGRYVKKNFMCSTIATIYLDVYLFIYLNQDNRKEFTFIPYIYIDAKSHRDVTGGGYLKKVSTVGKTFQYIVRN